jgi:hypothetical protein
MDAVLYITNALKMFAKEGPQRRQQIALEIALKGESGLDINDPEPKYTLKTLPGNSQAFIWFPSCTQRSGKWIRLWILESISVPNTRPPLLLKKSRAAACREHGLNWIWQDH